VLAADKPGFILIMEGTNDATRELDSAFIVGNLDSMVSQAQANHTIPVLATIPPNFRNDPGAKATIDEANTRIRNLARDRGIVLAEVFNGMNDPTLFGSPDLGINDPLHPNERGYVRMAAIFFDAMQHAFPGATTASLVQPAGRARSTALTKAR
jgi:lysophospholipase L1-like esterase